MNITRRDALMGATAAAVVTGAIAAPLAIKAAGVKAALAGDPVIGLAAQVKAAYRASVEADDIYEDVAHDAGYSVCNDFDWTTVTTTTGQRYTWGRGSILEAAARVEEEGEWQRITSEERDRALEAIDARMKRAGRGVRISPETRGRPSPRVGPPRPAGAEDQCNAGGWVEPKRVNRMTDSVRSRRGAC